MDSKRYELLNNESRIEGVSSDDEETAVSYEDALKQVGFGKFHFMLLLFCGLALSGDSVEVTCMSILLPSAECDMQLTSNDKGLMTALLFVGMLVGGYLFGALADIIGRRITLLISLTLNAVAGLISAFSPNFAALLVLRIFSGIAVGGSQPVIFSYFTEFQPVGHRGKMISGLAMFWMFGNVIAAVFALITIPFHDELLPVSSWRLFTALCSIPSAIGIFTFFYFPESPKFLLLTGKTTQAIQVLNKVRIANNIPARLTFNKIGFTYSSTETRGILMLSRTDRLLQVKYILQQIIQRTYEVARSYKRTFFVSAGIFFTVNFGYYGLWMWFPELFKRVRIYGGNPCLTSQSINTSVGPVGPNYTECVSQATNAGIYWDSFYTAVANMPGNIFATLTVDRLGRKKLLIAGLLICGVSSFSIYLVSTVLGTLLLSCAFNAFSPLIWNSLDVLMTELFPTLLRSTAIGVLSAVGRVAAMLANLMFGALVDANCAYPLCVVAGLFLVGCALTLLLPNTTNIDID